MSVTILFIHSAGEQSEDHGSSRLKDYLKISVGDYYKMEFPEMPDPENPRYGGWEETLEGVIQNLNGPLVLIGHSLGGSVLLKFLSEKRPDVQVQALLLIATPFWGKKEWDIEEFMLKPGFEKVVKAIPAVFIYHSHEDKWVPFSHSIQYAAILPHAKLRAIDGTEHEFYFGLPELIADIKSITNNGRSI